MNRIADARALMHGAELETGRSDWDAPFTGNPLELLTILVDDLNSTARLHELGARRIYRQLHENLCSRLVYLDDRKRLNGVENEPIDSPVFILGLPRSGTTFLHNLLGSDPHNRAPRMFEMLSPGPKNPDPMHRALRLQRARESAQFNGLMDDDWQGVHPSDADRAEECPFMWEMFLQSVNYAARAHIPNFERHVFSQDFAPLYQEQRALLQYLQYGEPRRRWILKTPIHVRFLPEIIDVFPDALFVHCHRDTAKIYPSMGSLTSILHSKHGDQPPGSAAVIQDYDGTWIDALAFRDRPGMADRFIDIQFVELQADPMATVERIYRHFGIATDDARRQVMKDWLEEDRRTRAGRSHHNYTLEGAGLTLDDIDRMTGDYLQAFSVKLER